MRNRMIQGTSWLLALLLAVGCFLLSPCTVRASSEIPEEQVVSGEYLERGITVTPNGHIYCINEGRVIGFDAYGTPDGFEVRLPTTYLGNMVATDKGVVIAHDYTGGQIFIMKPGKTNKVKKVYAGGYIQGIALDKKGNFYDIRNYMNDFGKNVGVVHKCRLSTVLDLEEGATIPWEETYDLSYEPPTDNGLYPLAMDFDKQGNAYIVDKGSYNGYDMSVNGIYKYDLETGASTPMFFSADQSVSMTWLYGISVDDFGNVAVLSRNSSKIALFRAGQTVAEQLIGTSGWVEDLASDSDGCLYYSTHGLMDETKNGVVRLYLEDVRVTGLKLSKTKKTMVSGDTFRLKALVKPANARNKKVTFKSSNKKIATVSSDGTITAKKAGKAVITVRTKQGGFTKKCTITVKPRRPVINKMTEGPGTLRVVVKKKAAAYGGSSFEARYREKGTTTWMMATSSKRGFTLEGLKKDKVYQIKVRVRRTVKGKTYYSKWSKLRTSKIIS